MEAEKCLEQSERLTNEKTEFELEIYAKVCYLKIFDMFMLLVFFFFFTISFILFSRAYI